MVVILCTRQCSLVVRVMVSFQNVSRKWYAGDQKSGALRIPASQRQVLGSIANHSLPLCDPVDRPLKYDGVSVRWSQRFSSNGTVKRVSGGWSKSELWMVI